MKVSFSQGRFILCWHLLQLLLLLVLHLQLHAVAEVLLLLLLVPLAPPTGL
jgi:hypothetical protein